MRCCLCGGHGPYWLLFADIRTNLIPFVQSLASWQLTVTTILIMGVGAYLPA